MLARGQDLTVKSVTSTTVLRWLDSVFTIHGYSQQIKSNNTSYFTSTEFRDMLKSWGPELRTVTECWPQANGQVEHFNEVLEKHVQTSRVEGKDWRQSITTTPHCMTRHTPAMLLLQWEPRTKLPSLQPEQCPMTPRSAWRTQMLNKRLKSYPDQKWNASPRNLNVGDWVPIKQKYRNKYSPFHPVPLKIIQVNSTQIILQDRNGWRQWGSFGGWGSFWGRDYFGSNLGIISARIISGPVCRSCQCRNHLGSSLGIISGLGVILGIIWGPFWGSFQGWGSFRGQDHFGSSLGIISGPVQIIMQLQL